MAEYYVLFCVRLRFSTYHHGGTKMQTDAK